jgi:hypothetical protein
MTVKFGKRPRPAGIDPSKMGPASSPLIANMVELATVGFLDDSDMPEATPAFIRLEQGDRIAELTTRTGDKITARVAGGLQLRAGQQVVVLFPDGDPTLAIVVAALDDALNPTASSCAGVSTGGSGATTRGVRLPAPTFAYQRLDEGRCYAVQTQGTGDILLHSGASVHLRASATGALHLDGTTHIGVAPLSPPSGSKVAPGSEEIQGAPAAPYLPEPYAAAGAQGKAPVPYLGLADGLVRARDLHQSNLLTDPTFWAWIIGVDAYVRGFVPALPTAPINLYSEISGAAGPGSRHTATGDIEPV